MLTPNDIYVTLDKTDARKPRLSIGPFGLDAENQLTELIRYRSFDSISDLFRALTGDAVEAATEHLSSNARVEVNDAMFVQEVKNDLIQQLNSMIIGMKNERSSHR